MSLTSYRAAPPRGGVGLWVGLCVGVLSGLGRPGSDLLSRVLRRSTIGAEGFHGRVRDGIGCGALAMTTRSSDQRSSDGLLLCEVLPAGGECLRSCARVGAGFTAVREDEIKPFERLVPVGY